MQNHRANIPPRGQSTPSPVTTPVTAAERADVLGTYFRDVSEHQLLGPDDEIRLAQAIEAADVYAWEQILSYAPTVEHVVTVVGSAMENSLPEFRSIKKAALEARKTRTKATRLRLAALAHKSATRLRVLDLDRTFRELVVAELLRIQRGQANARALSFVPKSRGFREYIARVTAAERAAAAQRTEFVSANLRLVVMVARKYRHIGMPLEDLIQEGNIGLMKAVDRYDYRRGYRFSTYATWWIRHAVGRALAQKGRTVRLPVHLLDAKQRISRVRRELSASLGRTPTTLEVAKAADLSAAKVKNIEEQVPSRAVSLDQPVGDDDGTARIDIFEDPTDEPTTPFDTVVAKTSAAVVHKLMRDLKPIEVDVLKKRFGLINDSELTLQEIANEYGLSRERIRQIQAEALEKLRLAIPHNMG